jgi:hypothetical protein
MKNNSEFAKKAVVVSLIASIITFLGGFGILNLQLNPLGFNLLALQSMWIAFIAILILTWLYDKFISKELFNERIKVHWRTNIVASFAAALGIVSLISLAGVSVPSGGMYGFVGELVLLFILMIIGLMVGDKLEHF